jgi:hypothetical protein
VCEIQTEEGVYIHAPGEILWHLHASATACVFTATLAQSTYNQHSDKLEIMVMWASLSGQHLLKSTTTNANIQRIRIVILGLMTPQIM